MENYWKVYPTLKSHLYNKIDQRPNYYELKISNEEIKDAIFNHPEFTAFGKQMDEVFTQWKNETIVYADKIEKGIRPKQEIHIISENLLKHYHNKPLTDKYAIFQHLMEYWAETMQDDFYELASDGWSAGNDVKRLEKKTKKGDKETVKDISGIEGLEGRLIPAALIIQEYFADEQKAIEDLEAEVETLKSKQEEIIEEHGCDDGLLADVIDDKGKISKANVIKRIKELTPKKGKVAAEDKDEYDLLETYKWLLEEESDKSSQIKIAKAELEKVVIAKYPKLSNGEIKTIVIERKWMAAIDQKIRTEMDNISHRLAQRIFELAYRYETPLPKLTRDLSEMTSKVEKHLKQMNFKW
jgi:type I restriction enzyme M protein